MITLSIIIAAMFVMSLFAFRDAVKFAPPRLLIAICAALLVIGIFAGYEMHQNISALREFVGALP